MANILIILGCSQEKHTEPMLSRDIYCSARFLAARKIAESLSKNWKILSAKHGIIANNILIEPYDTTIDTFSKEKYIIWINQCSDSILKQTKSNDHIIFIGDTAYFQDIEKILTSKNRFVFLPLKNIDKNKYAQWLNSWQISNNFINNIHSHIEYCGEKNNLIYEFCDFNAKICPEYGLYIFMHKNEKRIFHPTQMRIARIGTHAVSKGSKATLWQRIKTHMGTKNGLGNHRSSIFRSHIGSALIAKHNLNIPSWSKEKVEHSDISNEAGLEQMVSEYLADKFCIFCINIPGEPSKKCDRAYLERELIALTSSILHFSDIPPTIWLGNHSTSLPIKKSGLWNINHTLENYEPAFLKIFEQYIAHTVDPNIPISGYLAPTYWNKDRKSINLQLPLFPN